MRVLVCGGRGFNDRRRVFHALDTLHAREAITLLIEGGARGADSLGHDWAVRNGIERRSFPADWDRFGRSAGHRRNMQMLEEGCPELVVAFPGGSGTADMALQAERADVPVWRPFKNIQVWS